jgi:hypothetical protein
MVNRKLLDLSAVQHALIKSQIIYAASERLINAFVSICNPPRLDHA